MDLQKRIEELEEALRKILDRHDNDQCSCGGCVIARFALYGHAMPKKNNGRYGK